MLKITRQQFKDAIEAGIVVSEPTPAEAERLRLVAENATHADGNFTQARGCLNVGCPASQAVLGDSGRLFAYAYDDVIRALAAGNRTWWNGVDVV